MPQPWGYNNNNKHLRCGNRKGLLGRNGYHVYSPSRVATPTHLFSFMCLVKDGMLRTKLQHVRYTNYQLPDGPVEAGRRWGQRHPQGANLGSNGRLKFLSKLKQSYRMIAMGLWDSCSLGWWSGNFYCCWIHLMVCLDRLDLAALLQKRSPIEARCLEVGNSQSEQTKQTKIVSQLPHLKCFFVCVGLMFIGSRLNGVLLGP